MKALRFSGIAALAVVVGVAVVGCEWDATNDGSTWNTAFNARYEWVDFSGQYTPLEGTYLVRSHVPPATSAASLESWSEAIGTGSNFVSSFSATLSHVPVALGSIFVSDGNESFVDSDGDGLLVGSLGGTGSINYDTGIIQVSFNSSPSPGQSILVNYQFYIAGSEENPEPGSSSPIFTLLITQDADQLTFRDNNGDLYYGRLAFVETSGGSDNGDVAGEINATFEVSGNRVVIAGTLSGTYTPGATPQGSTTPGPGTLLNRTIRGTWMEHTGLTGDLVGFSPTPSTGAATPPATTPAATP